MPQSHLDQSEAIEAEEVKDNFTQSRDYPKQVKQPDTSMMSSSMFETQHEEVLMSDYSSVKIDRVA